MVTIFEELYPQWGQYFRNCEVILNEETSAGQMLTLIDTPTHGKVLLLDGVVQLTEKGNTSYHEMLVHPALFTMKRPSKVLIIGGGDGGTLKEVLRHDSIEHVVLVEIDENVVTFCREHFPTVGEESFKNPRVKLEIADGAQYVKDTTEKFDVILVDSTDPTPGSSDVLFTANFYDDCRQSLQQKGLLVVQAGIPKLQGKELQSIVRNLREAQFDDVGCLLVDASDYVGGSMALALSGKNMTIADAVAEVQKAIATSQFVTKLQYYNSDVHRACFGLPNYVKKLLA